jgi:Flp pilus assembly protein TadG
MMKALRRDQQGASAIEFALAAPAMLMFIIGIAQLGMLCMADAGLRSAVAEGARAASIYPTPDDDTILARIDEAAWGMQDEHITEPTILRDEDADGRGFIEITMSYDAPLNFAFMELEPVTLTEVRRVYTQGIAPSGSSSSGGGSSTGSTSSTGGTSASSASSTGGTSASSASSTGGTSATSSTSSTSTSSTSSSTGSTSSTSTGSTSSGNGSSGNASSGNASSGNNNGSSGHDHGGSSGNGHGNDD